MWAMVFDKTKVQIQELWGDNVIEIQYFGSTSIRGIWAKPMLDVAVVLEAFADMDVQAMTDIGYDYCGLQKPDNDRHLFVLRGDNEISLQHIHCYESNNLNFKHCVGFRDYSNNHLEAALEYSDLKRKPAEQFSNDRFAYTYAKGDFVKAVYDKFIEIKTRIALCDSSSPYWASP